MKNIAEIIDGETVHVYDLTQFDADAIMHSGQVFRYFAGKGGYSLIAGDKRAEIFTDGGKAVIKTRDPAYFFNYFDLQTDYDEIKRELSEYPAIVPAVKAGGGIRILRGEFAEIAVSFIISANNNIKRFTKTLNLMCERYGSKLPGGQYAFPTTEQLSAATAQDFKNLGCGYRDAYLTEAVRQIRGMDLAALANLGGDGIRREIMKIKGVGPKVCACIMLFAGVFHRLETAPRDTWINKALASLPKTDRQALLNHRYAGVAQQYVFYYLQHLRKEL